MTCVKFGTDRDGDDHWCEPDAIGQHHATSDCGCNPDAIGGSSVSGYSWTHHGVLEAGGHYSNGGACEVCSPPDDFEGECPHGCSPER